MDEDDVSINSSPTPIRVSTSRRSIRLRHKSTNTVEIKKELDKTLGVAQQCDSKDVNLFEVDRLDCLRAQQEPIRVRTVPASKNFMSLQSMLESQQFPEDESEAEVWNSPDISIEASNPPKTIVKAILLDFCGSPSYVEEDEVPSHDFTPWFRYRNKKIRTYSRKRLPPHPPSPRPISPNIIIEDEDERMSCSSGLSVQEDLITQMPTTTHCNFDANSSQMICENLQNLSAFFTQTSANSNIDLPANLQIKSEEINNLQDATDILDDNGYLIGNTEECRLQYEICDSKIMQRAELTLFNESTRPSAAENTAICKVEPLDTNVCDDWFDGDMNTEMISVVKEEKIEIVQERIDTKEISDIELLDGIPLSEWQPIDIPRCSLSDSKSETIANDPETVEFRTASKKHIEISEEKQIQAAQLMADLEAKQPSDDSNQMEFRTASNKTMILTEDMKKKAAMLMADLECGQATEEEQSNQFKGFHTAANKTIQVTEQMQRAGANLMADLEINRTKEEELLDEIPFSEWQPIEIETVQQQQHSKDFQAICSQLDMMPLDTVEPIAFRTASNMPIEITEEQQQRAARLMADLDANYSQTTNETSERISHLPATSEQIQFRTASNKTMELSEEMQRKAAMLMADLEPISVSPQSPKEKCVKSYTESVASERIQFRTASNKTVKLSEEMQKKAAMLMADLETISVPPQLPKEECLKSITDSVASENYQFRTASNKTMELSEEMQRKAAMKMADLEPISMSPKKEETAATLLLEDITNEVPELLEDDAEILVKPRKPEKQTKLIRCETSVLATSPATLGNAFDTPRSTPDMQISLTQLSERSPLDNDTKSSIITRRNLLSLNKRRKLKRDSENCNVDMPTGQTPMRQLCAPVTSTPVPSKRIQRQLQRDSRRDRSCSLESPSVQMERVGKRRSEEALSPIYAPTNKTRRLGLSRIRNKSSNDI